MLVILKKAFSHFIKQYWIAIISGAVLSLAFPPFKFGFLAYFSLIPVFIWTQKGSLKDSFKTGYWWGFGYHTSVLFWILNSTVVGGILALLFVPLYSGCVFLILRWMNKKFGRMYFMAVPFIWTAVEYIRTLTVIGFPWVSLAHTQTYYPVFIQYADMTGVYGVTFWICTINVLFYLISERKLSFFQEKRIKPMFRDRMLYSYSIGLLILIILPVLYGKNIINMSDWLGDTVKVSLAQGNVDMDIKSDNELRDPTFRLYESLTKEAAKSEPDLIVWPETAALTYFKVSNQSKHSAWMRKIVHESNSTILTGTFDYERFMIGEDLITKYYNAAVMFENYDSEGIWYSKIKLVPFGEWFPYENKFPFFEKWNFGQGNFLPGKEMTIFELPVKNRSSSTGDNSDEPGNVQKIKFATAICYESVFCDFIQKFCNKGAQMLVVITNNNWFGRTSSLYQHAQISVFRAVENRIGVAHCSNSGISLLIDPYGRVTGESGVFVSEVLTGDVFYRGKDKNITFYTKYGDVFSKTVLSLSGLFIIMGFSRRKKI
ncbi:apolipoprotein N-acyltransferase [candidate division KSB1 bacterium]